MRVMADARMKLKPGNQETVAAYVLLNMGKDTATLTISMKATQANIAPGTEPTRRGGIVTKMKCH